MKFDSWLNILKDGNGRQKLSHRIIRDSLDLFRLFITPDTKTFEVIYLREIQQLEWSLIDEKIPGLHPGESQNIYRSVQEILADLIVVSFMEEYKIPQTTLFDEDGEILFDDMISALIQETIKQLDTREKLVYKKRTSKSKRQEHNTTVSMF